MKRTNAQQSKQGPSSQHVNTLRQVCGVKAGPRAGAPHVLPMRGAQKEAGTPANHLELLSIHQCCPDAGDPGQGSCPYTNPASFHWALEWVSAASASPPWKLAPSPRPWTSPPTQTHLPLAPLPEPVGALVLCVTLPGFLPREAGTSLLQLLLCPLCVPVGTPTPLIA